MMRIIEKGGGYSSAYKQHVAGAALDVMASAFHVPVRKMLRTSRQKAAVSMARQIAMYLCNVVGQLSMREIAIEFDREPSTISHACHVVEDRRDDPVFDRQMVFLEEAMRDKIRMLIECDIAGESLPRHRAGLERKSVA